ncbi:MULTISPECIES: DUF7144 family membrane protein [Thermomonospora]|uniref:DUF7144 domain-containing protein n=1 Tax=Thermomonospora curvata (strain ATCC 19995 / DSM 43183 / JCM 3096 / KCTC 9072 / NBRC 15933 / NCIMB 10081 / Henssen B9) TaxID=471852 RepID=D1A1G7_THECD|nr:MULTISPECIES: hypothetical protein [Thermomonospora]ACY95889.1 hypothetical protein Tcur_0285 [Thermomonospora curvata DSM 43183]PKK16134.1 MAG: hypothetical protein BUE48_001415 [Thermomonospora sp. CIF 1]
MTTSATTRRTITSGWLTFAAVVFLLTGVFNVINGLVGIFSSDFYVVDAGQVLVFNFTAWGWLWLILGFVQIAVAAGIMNGMTWARAAGIALAALSIIGHMLFLAAFPWWSVLTIALSVLVIYALTVPPHGATAA